MGYTQCIYIYSTSEVALPIRLLWAALATRLLMDDALYRIRALHISRPYLVILHLQDQTLGIQVPSQMVMCSALLCRCQEGPIVPNLRFGTKTDP